MNSVSNLPHRVTQIPYDLDERGIDKNSPFYPHDVNCFRKAFSKQRRSCGGNEMMTHIKEIHNGR